MIRSKPKTRGKNYSTVKRCDDIVRERVYDRDGRACVRCGGTSALTPSHVYPKGKYQNIRWLEINILTMCWPCHRYFWHNNPADAIEWFEKNWSDRFRLLRTLKETMPKPDIKELLAELERE